MTDTPKRLAARASARNQIEFIRSLGAARQAAGVSLPRMSDLLGITPEDVASLERLDSDPRLSEIREYLTQLKLSMNIQIAEKD